MFNLTFSLSYTKTALRTNRGDALNSLSGGWEGLSDLTPFPLRTPLPPRKSLRLPFPSPAPMRPQAGAAGERTFDLGQKKSPASLLGRPESTRLEVTWDGLFNPSVRMKIQVFDTEREEAAL